MPSRLKKRTQDPPPTRQAASKRSRRSPVSDEDEDSVSESSESELSDLNEELEEETMNTLITGATKGGVEDDEDEESEESDDDTPEEREDSYIYEDSNDISEPDSSTPAPKSKKLSFKPPPAARASSRRKSAVTPSRKSNLSKVSGPDDVHMKDTITVAGGRGGKKGAVGARGTAKKDEKQTIKLTLKMGKDKLRAATSAWTPPPNPTTDSRTGNNNVATEESSSAEDKPSRGGARGRKVVQEEESSEEEDEDEDAEGEEVSDEDAEGEDDEDAEGEDDDGLNDEDAEGETDDEDMLDSDDDAEGTPDFRSRTGTPDMSRLTKRQKSRLDEVYSADLLELPTGIERPSAAKAIPLTADEQALKRAEMARRRKNLTDQRLEEEKMDTINKLLKKQTPKMRKNQGRQTGDATPAGTGGDTNLDGVSEAFPVPKMVRWVSNKDGIRVGVPDAWLTGPAGRVFEKQVESEGMIRARTGGRKMVEEIEDTVMGGVVPMEIEA